ncbi:MAG TPA: SMI1/KNR4 family protein [Kofleriaceae bacterium]|jgi:hypothetical protein
MRVALESWLAEFVEQKDADAAYARVLHESLFVLERLWPLFTIARNAWHEAAEALVIAGDSGAIDATHPIYLIEDRDRPLDLVLRADRTGWTVSVAAGHVPRFDLSGFETRWQNDDDRARFAAGVGWGRCDFVGFPDEYKFAPFAERSAERDYWGEQRFSFSLHVGSEHELYLFVWLLLRDRARWWPGAASPWPKMIERGPVASEKQLVAFEKGGAVALPVEYRAFVLELNGAMPERCYLVEHDAVVRSLYRLLEPDVPPGRPGGTQSLTLGEATWCELSEGLRAEHDIPGKCLAVASDDRDGVIFLVTSGWRRGEVWRFAERAAEPDQPLSYLAPSWRKFVEGLQAGPHDGAPSAAPPELASNPVLH